jgi:hypothetical protein
MARRTIVVSDLSGEVIAEGNGATVVITFSDARKGTIVLELTDAEAEKLGASGRKQARRGRKPKPKPPDEPHGGARPIEAVGTAVIPF